MSRDTPKAILAVATDQWTDRVRVELPFYGPATAPADDVQMESAVSDTTTYSIQHFLVVELGEGSEHSLRPGDEILVVPLGYSSSCAPIPWGDRTWIAPGDTVVFEVGPDELAVDLSGAPIFLQSAYRGPHPGSQEARFALLRANLSRRELGAREFFEYLHALPPAELVEADPSRALDEFSRWVQEHVDFTSYPVAESLDRLRRAVGRR